MARIVGIDLGTTNSVVAVLEGGRPQVIASAEGGRTTPSVVGFSKDQELLVGQLARRQLVLNPRNTFANLKRFVGRQWDELEDSSLSVPYTVRANDQGNVRVVCPATEREYAPEELVASILRKLVDDASTYLGEPVEAAVITVPAYFNDAQRQATRDAGRLAGLSVERILNEPTAAALAYGFDRSTVKRVLVFDLGGGTFDVSILRIAQGVFDVKATSGDTQLGGNDWDRRIVDWLADSFQADHSIDLRRDRQALQRLTEAAEKAKIELSGVQSTPISLPFIATGPDGPLHIETTLERSVFEGLCPDLLDRLLRPMQRALRDSGLAAEDIDDVVLVGGSTRMPMVQQMVRTLIPLEPCQSVNPDEVVERYGADTFRMYEMFLGPVEQDKPWDTKGIEGVHRFLKKLWRMFMHEERGLIVSQEPPTDAEWKALYKMIRKIEEDTERFSFNTSVSQFMIGLNELYDLKCQKISILEKFLIVLSPYAPHMCEELWQATGHSGSILDQPWPAVEERYLVETSKAYPVAVNGRTRMEMTISLQATQAEVEAIVLADPSVQKWLEGKTPKKVVYVPNRMINIVV